jgi:hypothetical protein
LKSTLMEELLKLSIEERRALIDDLIDGRTAYVWTVETRAPATPVPSTRVSYAAGVPNKIDTLSYPGPPRMERCTLRAFVDGAGNVTSTDWQGSNAGCYDAQQKLAGKG